MKLPPMNSTTRISYILDARAATAHFPGIGRYVRNLTSALAPQLAAGEHLTILCNPREKREEERELKGGSLSPHRAGSQVEIKSAGASLFGLSQQWRIPLLLKRLRFDKLHATRTDPQFPISSCPALYHSPYYLMPYRPGLPTLLTFYDVIPLRYPQSVSMRARLLYRLTTTLALRAASHVVAISEAAKDDLMRYFSVPPAQVSVTPLAVTTRFQPQPAARVERVRGKYALPARFVFYLGINKPHKNLPALIDAYAQLPARHAPPLVIAGAWDERYPQARQRAERRRLGDSVRFLGPVDDADLPALYRAATLFVFPSLYEGFGLPALEAMACGTPVACSNTASLPEIAGNACRLFDPHSVTAIRDAIAELLEDGSLRSKLSERGLSQASRFSWRATAAKTLHCYRLVTAVAGGQ